MDGLGPRPEPTFRLADRLAAVQRRQFVGRSTEISLFRSALLADQPPFAVLHIHGPGGVGKTSLLREFARVAQEAGIPFFLLDGRNVDPSPDGFRLALRLVMGLDEDAAPTDALAQLDRCVLLIDTYENMTPLDAWLRSTFLPDLPGHSLVVIAGRNLPAPAWRTDPGWNGMVRTLSLRNLRPEESRDYLGIRGVPVERYPAILDFTHGHPLALSLVADGLAQGDESGVLLPENEPHLMQVLLERFLQHVPGPAHRRALEVCAHARVTTETLLADVLDVEDVHPVFEWLRGLSIIEQGPHGLFPHDLAREVLDADLRWRDPEAYHLMHRRIRDSIIRRLRSTQGVIQQRAFFDLLYLHRHNPLMKPFYQWKSLGNVYAEAATERDFPVILDMVRRHEGDATSRIAEHWLKRQPAAFTVFRAPGNELIGFAAHIAIHAATSDDLETDPALEAAWGFVRRYGQVRPSDEMIYHRFVIGRDVYQQASPAYDMAAMSCFMHWLTNSRLSWCFIAMSNPEYWRSTFTYLNLRRSPEADFEVGGRTYGVFTHDWRAEPALAWLDLMAERELATDLKLETIEAQREAPLVVLSQPDFENAVRRALRDYRRPAALAANPLLRSRAAAKRAGTTPTPATLQKLLAEAADTLKATPRDEKLYRAIWRTYLEPAATQELAAEALGLPFSTYRYHLAGGVERIIEWMWQLELSGSED